MNKWFDIPGYVGFYQINESGEVKSLMRCVDIGNSKKRFLAERILKNSIKKEGYHFVRLSKNSVDVGYRIHRLVATIFIPNPNNLPEVNHIDGNKGNNHVSNLEWCTKQENITHSWVIGLRKRKKAS